MKTIQKNKLLAEEIKSYSIEQLENLTKELRQELIEIISQSGGHFASSLGAAELSVALHHSFNTPEDKLIWDVGHQAYIHKMLTGRRDQLPKIRTSEGISGFLKREESTYDAFGAGHAGTSISAAVGMAVALKESHPERKVVAIIGDGSITAGMAFEALNNAGALELKNLIVVLNDNEMSISPNVGAISWLFSKAITSKFSTRVRAKFKKLYKQGVIPKFIYRTIDKVEELTQAFMISPAFLFESFGFRYIGPVDGHNISDLLEAFERAKNQDVPVIIHAATLKGKGFEPAEEDPVKWHGVTPFNKNSGEILPQKKNPAPSYTNVFAETLIKIANQNKNIIGITAAMPGGTGLDKFALAHPDKYFDVGICEQHAVTFAAGLACEEKRPVVAIYSTFLQRAFDQIVHDVCIQNLPVVFAIDRAGCVGNDGETHQGVFDISYLRAIPNMCIMSAKDENELQHMLYTACCHFNAPIAIRYPRGNGIGIEMDSEFKKIEIGKAEVLQEGEDVLLIGLGPIVNNCINIAEKIKSELKLNSTVINARFAKPLDQECFAKHFRKSYKAIAIIEDHSLAGGFSSAVLEFINAQNIKSTAQVLCFGTNDNFISHASQLEQHAINGMDVESVFEEIKLTIAGGNSRETPVNSSISA